METSGYSTPGKKKSSPRRKTEEDEEEAEEEEEDEEELGLHASPPVAACRCAIFTALSPPRLARFLFLLQGFFWAS